ncbi:DUF3038 domain-containing protein [Leptolyngbya sp. FACHB-16]|uniref:DUF3038 domain-containing protein n=1 Tax=unclassified Leptolyngbya TaxID=2650499 RepID=UPI001686548C|nr:DUF3038 domain-containing protein [Leptolyngbya sp. FACHB-16]MBD2153748.1 DUF3038 domain-containing protein [Leptolyngbya sp. FACHB-16]
MQVDSPPTPPHGSLLDALPNIDGLGDNCPRRARVQLDLLLLAIEALDLNGSEALLSLTQELNLKPVIENRVKLWRLRCTNPLRRYGSQHRELSQTEGKALVMMISSQARRLTVLIRQLLLAYEQLNERNIPLESSFRLSEYLERFRAHFRSRMNPKRAAVMAYNTDEKLNSLALSLLSQLLFCTGISGTQRLWISLFDGEVA